MFLFQPKLYYHITQYVSLDFSISKRELGQRDFIGDLFKRQFVDGTSGCSEKLNFYLTNSQGNSSSLEGHHLG